MTFILDLIVLVIIVLFVIFSVKKGFVKTLIEFVGLLLAIYLSITISSPLSNFVYDKAVEPTVSVAIGTAIENTGNAAETTIKEAVYNSLPGFISNNIDLSQIEIGSGETAAQDICDNLVKPLSISFFKALFTLVLFIVLNIVVKLLAKIINKIFSFRILGTLNRVLGGVLGLIKGIIFAVIFVIVTQILISLTGGFFIFTKEAVDASVIFGLVAKILPASFLI